jgi:DNA ligase (NAD+)
MNIDYSNTINELVDYLNVCRNEYYNKNNSIITDQQYDDLFDKLVELEKESGIILSNSPTQSVGYPVVSNLNKVKHKRELLSLDKTKNVKDITKFCGTKDVLIMHKLDGLTVDLTYEN